MSALVHSECYRVVCPPDHDKGRNHPGRQVSVNAILANGVVTYLKQLPMCAPSAAERHEIEAWFATSSGAGGPEVTSYDRHSLNKKAYQTVWS